MFIDASVRNLENKKESTLAYLIFLSEGYEEGKEKKCCVLTWKE